MSPPPAAAVDVPPYPPARRGDEADDFHGEVVADPYRWLEDADSEETRAFVAAENELTEHYLSAVASREAIRGRLTELWSSPRWGVPFERGGRWFQFRNSGLQNQDVLYVMAAANAEAGEILLDPNALSAEGTVAVTAMSVSEDGRLLAYGTSEAGSDWRSWHVRDVTERRDRDDVVEWSKYTEASWLGDASGFFYGAPEAPEPGNELRAQSRNLRVLLHRLGTPQEGDEVIFSAPDEPEWVPRAAVSHDGRYLVVSISKGTAPESQIHVLDLDEPAGLRPLVGDFSSVAEVVGNVGSRFYVLSEQGAPRGRLVAIDLEEAAAGTACWREVIPEGRDTLADAHLCGGHLVCHFLEDAHSRLSIFDLEGAQVSDVPLPGLVSLLDGAGPSIEGRPQRPVFHFKVTSFLESGSIWRHDLEGGLTELVRSSPTRLDPAEYLTEEVFVTSADGTAVPLFVSRRRDLERSGDVPVLLYGYGGFNISMTPSFGIPAAVWMERGGLYAQAALRGGGEYGTSWHDAGRLAHKQNVFDDFCACARHFVADGWSQRRRVAISGGSNGGLLVGACLTQHPELFGAAVPEVGVLDMLRFHKFTIGWAWTSDFGDPDDPAQYPWPRAYSPLHHVVAGTDYPATMVMTGDHDDRVVPGHSLKFAAAMQAAVATTRGAPPVLLRVETSAGHGAGKPTAKVIAERTDFLAFLEAALGLQRTV
ncbi:MAG: prolyl oligopeptidase family serine peptidase [Acidimicrobiales bacterium]